jgi:propionyl-CoA synthetase
MESKDKYIRYPDITNDFTNPAYDEIYKQSMENKEEFWKKEAEALVWTKKPTEILRKESEYMYKWYPDGEMNICYNCVDRHVDEGRGDH